MGMRRISTAMLTQPFCVRGARAGAVEVFFASGSGGKRGRPREIDLKPDQHADPRRTETPMPAVTLRQLAANDGRADHRDLYTDVIDLERIAAARIVGPVKVADLR